MSSEDVLYDAYNEGLLKGVYKIMEEIKEDDKWKYREYSDKYSHALSIARERKASKSKRTWIRMYQGYSYTNFIEDNYGYIPIYDL